MSKEERYGILYKDEKGYRHFNNIKCSTRLNYKGDDIIPLWEFAESLQSQLDIANKKLDEIKEKTEFDMKMWGKEDGFILINGNKLLSIIDGE